MFNSEYYLPLLMIGAVILTLIAIMAPSSHIETIGTNKTTCQSNEDCGWMITNCCPENAGAKWECVNLKTYKSKPCPKDIICPQVISPKPTIECICVRGRCAYEAES